MRHLHSMVLPLSIVVLAGCGGDGSSTGPGNPRRQQGQIALVAPGGWTGGGGLLMKDSFNPWWVKNTKVVSVCLEVDEENFGISTDRAEELARGSINWWKQAFASVEDPDADNPAGVGLQEFNLSRTCTPETELRLQFGVLHAEQKKQWKKYIVETPQSYAGIAIRTDYDRVNMGAKGFIYLSPQKGPLKLELGPNQVKNPWSVGNGKIAALFLMHELGHVFGYQHSAAGWVMSSDVLNRQLQPRGAEKYTVLGEPYQWLESPFQISSRSDETCFEASEYALGREFFALPAGELCVLWVFRGREFVVSWRKTPDESWIAHASAVLNERGSSWRDSDTTSIFLPKENVVFPDETLNPEEYLVELPVAPLAVVQKGVLRTNDGKVERTLTVRRHEGEERVEIEATLNGKELTPSELLPTFYDHD